MFDNTGNMRAVFNGVSIEAVSVGGGSIRAVVKTEDTGALEIYDKDEQGSIDGLLLDIGSYISVSYIGDVPSISYEAFTNDGPAGSIFAVSYKGLGIVKFSLTTNQDFMNGAYNVPLDAVYFGGRSKAEVIGNQNDTGVVRSFALVSAAAELKAGGTYRRFNVYLSVTKSFVRVLAAVPQSAISEPTLRKRIVITPYMGSGVVTVATGMLSNLADNDIVGLETGAIPVSSIESIGAEPVVNDFKKLLKIIERPRKIFDTEGVL